MASLELEIAIHALYCMPLIFLWKEPFGFCQISSSHFVLMVEGTNIEAEVSSQATLIYVL
jgi:hypothetical protein